MEPLRARGHVFQLTIKEARVALDVVIRMLLSISLLIVLYVILIYVTLLGTFLVNSFPALV